MADKPEDTKPRRGAAPETDLDTLRSDLDALRAELGEVMKSIQGLGATAVAAAKRQQGVALERLSSEAESLTAAGRDQLAEVEQRIRAQPLAAVGIAFVVGWLFGSLRR